MFMIPGQRSWRRLVWFIDNYVNAPGFYFRWSGDQHYERIEAEPLTSGCLVLWLSGCPVVRLSGCPVVKLFIAHC